MMFYWDNWNIEHSAKHGISRDEAKFVVSNAIAPYPEYVGDGKYCVRGPTAEGRLIQVIFTYTSPERMDYEEMTYDDIVKLESERGPYVYVIHAHELTESEKRSLRKRRR